MTTPNPVPQIRRLDPHLAVPMRAPSPDTPRGSTFGVSIHVYVGARPIEGWVGPLREDEWTIGRKR